MQSLVELKVAPDRNTVVFNKSMCRTASGKRAHQEHIANIPILIRPMIQNDDGREDPDAAEYVEDLICRAQQFATHFTCGAGSKHPKHSGARRRRKALPFTRVQPPKCEGFV